MTGPSVHLSTISLRTKDGLQPVQVFTPSVRPRGGVIVYMDAFGWREELDSMAARYAEAGWLTFLPDLYYWLGSLRFAPPAGHQALDPAMHAANSATTMDMSGADVGALLAHAEISYPDIMQFGAVGYCMGARHALNACARFPEKIVAAACLHGGRMVDESPASPHFLIRKVQGELYFGFAEDDDTCPPEHQALIEQTILTSDAIAEVEHFEAAHGWTFPTRWCYDEAAAERAFAKVLALFARNTD